MHISTIIGSIFKAVFVIYRIMACLMLSSTEIYKSAGEPQGKSSLQGDRGQVLWGGSRWAFWWLFINQDYNRQHLPTTLFVHSVNMLNVSLYCELGAWGTKGILQCSRDRRKLVIPSVCVCVCDCDPTKYTVDQCACVSEQEGSSPVWESHEDMCWALSRRVCKNQLGRQLGEGHSGQRGKNAERPWGGKRHGMLENVKG